MTLTTRPATPRDAAALTSFLDAYGGMDFGAARPVQARFLPGESVSGPAGRGLSPKMVPPPFTAGPSGI